MRYSVIHLLATFILMLSPYCCLATECGSLDTLRGLLGHWQAENDKTLIDESWRSVSPTTFEGEGLTRYKNNDTRKERESLRLVEMSGGVFYLAKVEHNPLPVAFKLIACVDGLFVFENGQHDFPKRLAYHFEKAGSLSVKVSDGKDKGFEILYRRQNSE